MGSMNILELHSDKPNTVWVDSETFLCVFDENNNLVIDYDFFTGLRLLQKDNEITIYMHDEDLVSGNWTLFATKIDEQQKKTTAKIKGEKKEHSDKKIILDGRPWDYPYSTQEYVSRKEREERLSICKSCPFFDIENMTCKVDGGIVLDKTKYLYTYCPEEKWGDKAAVIEKFTRNGRIIDEQEQQKFEKELEEYLKGK